MVHVIVVSVRGRMPVMEMSNKIITLHIPAVEHSRGIIHAIYNALPGSCPRAHVRNVITPRTALECAVYIM